MIACVGAECSHYSTDPSSNIPLPEAVVPTKPYDWTYTTLYSGHTEQGPSKEWQPADSSEPTHTIPMAELTRPDPILYYAEVPIFDSELDDNGSSSLLVRIVSF
jgi:type 2A phosphatase activator TIP41